MCMNCPSYICHRQQDLATSSVQFPTIPDKIVSDMVKSYNHVEVKNPSCMAKKVDHSRILQLMNHRKSYDPITFEIEHHLQLVGMAHAFPECRQAQFRQNVPIFGADHRSLGAIHRSWIFLHNDFYLKILAEVSEIEMKKKEKRKLEIWKKWNKLKNINVNWAT